MSLLRRLRRRFSRVRGRWVRIHLANGAPSVEGVYRGCRAGLHFVDAPRLITSTESAPEQLAGELAVPQSLVVYLQFLER